MNYFINDSNLKKILGGGQGVGGGGGGGGASVSEFFQLRIQISNNFF